MNILKNRDRGRCTSRLVQIDLVGCRDGELGPGGSWVRGGGVVGRGAIGDGEGNRGIVVDDEVAPYGYFRERAVLSEDRRGDGWTYS